MQQFWRRVVVIACLNTHACMCVRNGDSQKGVQKELHHVQQSRQRRLRQGIYFTPLLHDERVVVAVESFASAVARAFNDTIALAR
jgi:hypothetical protein